MSIRIALADVLAEPVEHKKYNVCGLIVRTDVAVSWLSPFAGSTRGPLELETPRGLSLSSPIHKRREIVGAVAGRERRLEIETGEHGLRMDIESVGEFFISADGSAVRLSRRASQVDRLTVLECVLGAPLVVSLALRGRWLLHASAVDVGGRVVAFAGPSGAGKSTLAAHLGGKPSVARVADDVLCYGLRGSGAVAVPGFPQLKLVPDQQPIGPPQPLAAVMLLVSVSGARRVSTRQLQGRDKLLGFLEHGVATRAFPASVLARNLKIAAQLVENIDVIEVQYPKTQEALKTLALKVDEAYSVSSV